jgi:hypothetical protein
MDFGYQTMKRILLLLLTLLFSACAPLPSATPTESFALVITPLSTAVASLTPFAPFAGTPSTATALPLAETPLPPTVTPLPPTTTATPLPVYPSDTPLWTETPSPTISYTECGWQWARQNLPEVSAQFLGALQIAGLPVETARAEAYGENCLGQDGSVVRFAAMETDFYLTFAVADLADEATLGQLLEQTFSVLDQFPVGQTPGPNPGYIGITFKAGEQAQNLWFLRTRIAELRSQNLTGAALYQALK